MSLEIVNEHVASVWDSDTSKTSNTTTQTTEISPTINGKAITHNGAIHLNGSQHAPACLASTKELRQWKETLQTVMERCDLSGLSREPVKYQLASTGLSGTAPELEQRTTVIPADVQAALESTCLERQLAPQSIVLFAVHQMLKGFGDGSHTVSASFIPCQDGQSWRVTPTTVSHEQRQNQTVLSALEDIKSFPVSLDKEDQSLAVPGDLVSSELLDIVVTFDNAAAGKPPLPDFPLVLLVDLEQENWKFSLQYALELFDGMVIDSFLSALQTLLAATEDTTSLVAEIELIPAQQLEQMSRWNSTDGEYPANKRLHQLFEEAALQHGNRTALVYGEKQVTFANLNEQGNRLAHHLCYIGIYPEQLIGLFLDKSDMMITTILGIWKSGAAYTPIDPAYPDDRVRFLLDDTQVGILIASRRHVPRLQNNLIEKRQLQILTLESVLSSLHEQPAHTSSNLDHLQLNSKQLAYVTYTSGTTGFPKGIYKEHTSVVNSITDLSARYGVSGSDDEVILLFSAYVFEPFVRQMLMALTTGNTLAIINDEDKFDPDILLPFIRRHKVTYLNGTASVVQEYDLTTCPSLKRLVLVGENLTEARYKALRRRFKARILSEYGFTESAFVTALNIFDPASERTNMSLGRPVRNVKCYILDSNLKRLPLGVTGELHIGGLGISRGYMNRDELTRAKFLKNPYQDDEKGRGVNGLMYKTGDLARWLPNGEVEYLGRADFQIKLRGIRIEPGEIESTLGAYPGIRTSIVVSKKLLSQGEETRQDHLVGYFVCDDEMLSESDILKFLEQKLPRYMIPTRLVQLEQIPVTINGKADLRALPAVELAMPSTCIIGRRDKLDDMLADIWAGILQVPASQIGLEQNFFHLGGHSITCIQLIARVRQHLAKGISVEEVFQTKTLRAMVDMLKEKQDAPLTDGSGSLSSDITAEEGVYMANSLQQGFVYHSLKTQQSEAYIMQSVLRYQLPLTMDKYRHAWTAVQKKHPALRLRFAWEGNVTQIVDQEPRLDWRVLDWSRILDKSEEQDRIARLQQSDRAAGYRLGQGPLMRLYIINLPRDETLCLFSCHHAILDGWSLPLLFEDVHDSYLGLLDGVASASPVDLSYIHSQQYLQRHRDHHLSFWSCQLDQVEERCDMNALLNESSRYKVPLADYDRIVEQKQQTIQLPWTDSMKELKAECLNQGLTIHSVLQLVWHLVLHSYGGGTTITGTTISGRYIPVEGIERSIGMFINTLPLIFDHERCRGMTALEAISHIQDQVNVMNSRGNVELGRLRKDDLKHGLFDTLFVLENYPNLDTTRRLAHQQRLGCHIQGGTEKLNYPLAVIVEEHGLEGYSFTLCYASELFTDDSIQVLLHTVDETLAKIAHNVHAPIRALEFLSPGQMEQLDQWNANEFEFPSSTLHAVFESEAQQHPDKVAVVYEDVRLTYRELNSRANALAYHLLSKAAIGPNKIIGLVMEKSEHMINSIFAVWKTGGAYVPIDASYPDHRIKYILEDTAALAVIADGPYLERLESIMEGSLPLIPSDEALRLPPSPVHPNSNCHSSDLAYVMYTSGTTGLPKGVMVEHHGVVNLAFSLAQIFGLRDTDDEVILSFSNYIFDHFVEQMTDALLNGQTLVVLNDEMRGDKERLYKYIEDNKVTYLSGTPSVISMYEFDRFHSHMRRIDCVGEAFSEPVFDKIRETFPGLVINGYGPTEVSITTSKRLYPFPERRTNKSIGSQVSNSKSYVLSDDMKRMPIGAVGELYLGGDGVARGYHNRPELTAERFPQNPFQTEQEKREGRNGRLYKTGDLVRWIQGSNGEVEYLGRNDFQVKIRGQRIELGEIEAVLSSYEGIKQSVVLAKDRKIDNQKFLVGYYLGSESLSAQAIRRYMQTRLPSYMVPARLVPISKFPTTPSGKLDSKALPTPEDTVAEDIVPPRSEVERVLAGIWAELLEVPLEGIGIYSDFFGLGGDSLKSTRLSFAATKALGVAVSVSNLFSNPTIESLSQWIESGSKTPQELVPCEAEPSVEFPLSPAQERLVFIHELNQDAGAYNIAWHLKLHGNTSLEALEKALRDIIGHHEALRTLLARSSGSSTYTQTLLDNSVAQGLFTMDVLKLESEDEMRQKMIESDRHMFNLDSALPILVRVYQVSRGSDQGLYASLVFHHLAFDAWSWGVFKQDAAALYAAHLSKRSELNVSTLRVQYKEYSLQHRQILQSDRRQVLAGYWLDKLSDLEPLHLITDHPRPSQFDYAGKDLRITIPQEITSQLKHLAKAGGTSLYTVMAAAFILLMNVYTNQLDITIGVPVSHRTHADFESVIGFFVNLLPLRVKIGEFDMHGLISAVQKELVDAQAHQDMPFQDITKLLRTEHDLGRHPVVQTIFNWETAVKGSDTDVLGEEYNPACPLPSVAKFDLNVTITDASTSLEVNFNYATSLFEEETIRGFMDTFSHVVEQFAHNSPLTSLSDLSYTSSTTSPPHLLAPVSVSFHESPSKSLLGWFEEQVATSPSSIAVTDGNRRISYHDINIEANKMANCISSRVKVDMSDRLALVLDKSIEMIVSILAVWKLGAAYVPLDPSYPTQRIEYILEATAAKALITTSKHETGMMCIPGINLISIDDPEVQKELQKQSLENFTSRSSAPSNPAYIIFTSGTTGKPKGVLVEHSSVAKLRDSLVGRYFGDTNGSHAVLFLSNYVFDFSLEQLCLSIFSGNKLVIPPEEGLTHEFFYAVAEAEKLSYISGTPSTLQQIQLSRLNHLQMVTAAGEEFHSSHYDSMRGQFKGPINNAYGITETSVYNIVTTFDADMPFTKALCEELPGTLAYVLNDNLQRVPPNAVGELYIGGECLSLGYLNQKALTEERFIPNPFTCDAEQRLYKTGDMVRSLGSRGIEFIGRRDQQVKLRGFRIELSEIRDAVLSSSGVKEAVVFPRYDETKSSAGNVTALVCCYVAEDRTECPSTYIREQLSSVLPQFMIPSQIHCIEGSFPVTVNGKLDMAKLSELGDTQELEPFSNPRNTVEVSLCQLWASSLGLDQCGIDDDLFARGGDSISSLQLVGDIHRTLGQKVTIKDIFLHRTVRAICDNVLSLEESNGALPELRADQGLVEGSAPLLPIQHWFLEKPLKKPGFWNHCFTVRTPSLVMGKLRESLNLLHERHDVLRLKLAKVDGNLAQTFPLECNKPELTTLDVTNFESMVEIEEALSSFQSTFNIDEGPMYAVAYLHGYPDGSARVWFALHHLIVDTVSWNIIRSDLQSLYEGASLGPKTSSVQQWAIAVDEYAASAEEVAHWDKTRKSAVQSAQSLPIQPGGLLKCENKLSAAITAILLQTSCSRLGIGMHEIALVAVGTALQSCTGNGPTVVTVEGHGREESVDSSLDVSRTVGWFTSMYPLELPTIRDPISGALDIKKSVGQVPNNGVGYGPLHGYLDGSLPGVSFNYLGVMDQAQARPGDWTLTAGDGEPSQGLCTALDDSQASSSMVDVTMFVLNGQLTTQISSTWGFGAAHGLFRTIQDTLETIAEKTAAEDFVAPLPTNEETQYEPYFLFEGDSRRGQPLFLLPPGEGGAESYFHNIVKGLPGRNLVVFNNYYRHKRESQTIEGLADYYLSHIRSIQPEGPYDLLGWSFGGILALEIAERLASSGQRISTLALIDPYFDVPGASSAIEQHDSQILDTIYHAYHPHPDKFRAVEALTGRIILFKAAQVNEGYGNPPQRRLYEWYAASSMNNLDAYVSSTAVQVLPLNGTHFTWVHDTEQVHSMCEILEQCEVKP
uniref:Alpha-aminoadipyl-cysteinyl-valine synthetase n=1 Tax=Kallichroma tethys TaxID=110573 RepID=Q9C1G0_9HYPO|nr:alpha-aminoadipyl-cysteinyl-valine synthetase [Kallichroma tethys]